MADILAALQSAGTQADSGPVDIGAILDKRAQEPDEQPRAKLPAPTKQDRVWQGVTDLPTGLGQLTEHVAETPMNGIRAVIRAGLNASGAKDAATLFAPVTTGGFDDIVKEREQSYAQARADAQQTGIDWWRLAGQVANPVNYLVPGKIPASVASRIGAGAAQGAAVSAVQPGTDPQNFWWDKAKGVIIGGATGGALSGAVESVMPLIRAGVNAARKALGTSAAASPAADAVVNSALAAKGVDPATIDVNVLSGLKQEAQNALEHGETPSAQMVALRAKAESLPFPIPLLKGQLMGNEPGGAMQFAKEQNLRGIEGVGEPIAQRLTDQNAAAINNLDALGAKGALDPVELGNQMAPKIQGLWDQLQDRKNALYAAVRNSKGQPAAMDQFTAAKQIKDTLDTPEQSHAYDLLPANIKRTIDDLQDGKLPLTVAQMQSFDKQWGAAARGADGSTAYAINTARRILNDAPIADDVGVEAKQAYEAARAAHAQQMALVDKKLLNGMPNPKYQPLVDDVVYGGKPPETLFDTHFMKAAPSTAAKNLQFVAQLDSELPKQIGHTYMGEIKRIALSGASDERATVSQATLNRMTQPVAAARMDALLPAPAAQTFRNLADVIEAAKRHPTGAAVNTSNTGSAAVNAGVSMLKQNLGAQIAKRLPVVKQIAEAKAAADAQTGVQEAIKPGVTLNSILRATPRQALGRSLAGRALIPAAAGTENSGNE